MRAMAAGLAILTTACTAESLHPTYRDDQLVAVPGLDGIWRKVSTDPRSVSDEMVLYAVDSLTYDAVWADADEDASRMTVRAARAHGVTFLDLVGEQGDATHQFALATIAQDRIEMLEVSPDSVKALVKRAPAAVPHFEMGDRLILSGTTEQVQSFLIDASRKPGFTAPQTWIRIADGAVCSDMPLDTVTSRYGGGSTVSDFDLELIPRRDSSAAVVRSARTTRLRSTGSLLTIDDTLANMSGIPELVLSPTNPYVVVTDARVDRRLEMRRVGVSRRGFLRAEIVLCHDQLPSSREAVRNLPAPSNTTMRIATGQEFPTAHYSWSPVPGATAYEVLWSQYSSTDFRSPGSWGRAIVRDTSFTMRSLGGHTWRVRAFAERFGFGPLSAVQLVPRPAP